jgi:hypothetical protein
MYAKFLWRAVHLLFGLTPPQNIDDLFNGWSKKGNKKENALLLTVASTLCWTVWITRNEVIFDKYRPKSFLQVLFRGTHWLRQWAKLQRGAAGQHLESSACISSVSMDGYQQDLLAFLSQNSTCLFYPCVSM